jgi:hypothetical protein
MLPYEERLIAFDSNVLIYFLDGNKGYYSQARIAHQHGVCKC